MAPSTSFSARCPERHAPRRSRRGSERPNDNNHLDGDDNFRFRVVELTLLKMIFLPGGGGVAFDRPVEAVS